MAHAPEALLGLLNCIIQCLITKYKIALTSLTRREHLSIYMSRREIIHCYIPVILEVALL